MVMKKKFEEVGRGEASEFGEDAILVLDILVQEFEWELVLSEEAEHDCGVGVNHVVLVVHGGGANIPDLLGEACEPQLLLGVKTSEGKFVPKLIGDFVETFGAGICKDIPHNVGVMGGECWGLRQSTY